MISRISAGLHLVGLAGFPVHGVSVAGEDKEYYSSFVQLRSFLFINEYFINLSSVPTDRDMNSRSLLVWIFFALAAATKSYDDLIVAVGDQIEILTNGSQSNPLKLENYNASVLVALAYDPSSQKLFFSDKRNRRGHVFSVTFDGIKAQGSVHDVVERGTNESVEALTYDNLEKTLLWTDGTKQSIRRFVVEREDLHVYENNTIELVHLLRGDKPRGLISDPCTRMLYWTNWNIDRPTIERSYLNGSHREVIVHKGLFMPHGLGLDVSQQMIYWANNLRHGTFQIERSKVDGSDRELLYEGKGHEMRGQFIFGLTVGEHDIYWTDWDQKSLWSLPKEGSIDGPVSLRRFQYKPMAVIILQRQPVHCSIDIQHSAATTELIHHSEHRSTPAMDSSSESNNTPQEFHVTPVSETDSGLCIGYCFNEGHCFFVNNEISCSCAENYSGDRCEITDTVDTSRNSCGRSSFSTATEAENSEIFIALMSTSVMCVILIIAVIILSFRVWRLSSGRSRFKRRVIKGKNYRPAAERVINIEDCCNMNICETTKA
ncbi:protein cueball-like isoform X2 [Daphnia pulex]|uniref:protein cueball-like isoform X2 n=1 Tax=Daphnia pulex TaxID=6669 RepID=UPI001EDEB396|nr:protein cueball-like isoform X2 [Daphnia pulex]